MSYPRLTFDVVVKEVTIAGTTLLEAKCGLLPALEIHAPTPGSIMDQVMDEVPKVARRELVGNFDVREQ